MMWELGNVWTEGGRNSGVGGGAPPPPPMGGGGGGGGGGGSSSSATMMHEIHVLLVDHDSEALITTAKQLEICHYRVTFVELASAAISMLLSGKAKFDVVIANINSPDLHGFKLLQHAVTMGLPVVLMSVDDNAFMAMRALENGAFLYIKKPATMEILRCLWQHVLREKARLIRERDMFLAANNVSTCTGTAPPVRGVDFREGQPPENPHFAAPNTINGGGGVYRRKKGRSHEDEECDSENPTGHNVRRKMCTEWTRELHAKFMDAVERLGEGRCFPKEILELMNVPGLTRMQVASHLQKCRNDNWRSPEDRKPQAAQLMSQNTNGSQIKPRRFGSKPQVSKTLSGETRSGSETPTNGANMGNGSTVTDTYRHKKYGSMVPGLNSATPGTNSSSNPTRHSSDEFFNFPDMDCLIQNLSSVPQQGSGLNNPSPPQGATHFDPAYNDVQNSGGGSMETRSNWSTETSNFESDQSEARGPDDE